MGKFCEYCGRELQEGEVCTCQQTREPAVPVNMQQMESTVRGAQPEDTVQAVGLQKEDKGQNLPQEPFLQNQPQGQLPQEPFLQSQPYGQFQQEPYQQGQPQDQFPQGQPYGQFQQGQPYGQFQQGQPYGQFQQGQSYGQFQQPYQQGQPYGQFQQGQPQGSFPQGQPYGPYQQGQPFMQNPSQPNKTVEKIKGFSKKAKENFLNLMKNPVTTGQNILQEADVKMAGFMIVLQAVFSAFFALIVCNKIWRTVLSASKMVADQVLSALGLDSFGYYMGDVTDNIQALLGNAPYGKTFFYTLVFSILLSALLAGAFLLGHRLIKMETSYQKMLTVVSLRSMLLLPTTLVAMVLVLISPILGMIVFAGAAIWGFVIMLLVMQSTVDKEKKNIFANMYAIVLVVFLLVLLLFDSMGIKEIATDIMALFS